MKNLLKLIPGLFISCIGVLSFWAIFFKLAPYVVSLIPKSDWSAMISFLTYILIAWIGGVTIPLMIFICGIWLLSARVEEWL